MRAIVSYEVETDLSADDTAELVEYHMCGLPTCDGVKPIRMVGSGVQVSVTPDEEHY